MSTTTERRAVGRWWAAPGWYRDPADDEQLRWWDGHAWTSYTRPNPGVQHLPLWFWLLTIVGSIGMALFLLWSTVMVYPPGTP